MLVLHMGFPTQLDSETILNADIKRIEISLS